MKHCTYLLVEFIKGNNTNTCKFQLENTKHTSDNVSSIHKATLHINQTNCTPITNDFMHGQRARSESKH